MVNLPVRTVIGLVDISSILLYSLDYIIVFVSLFHFIIGI